MLAAVNCEGDGKELCSEHGIKRFPTIRYFYEGKPAGDFPESEERNAPAIARNALRELEKVVMKKLGVKPKGGGGGGGGGGGEVVKLSGGDFDEQVHEGKDLWMVGLLRRLS